MKIGYTKTTETENKNRKYSVLKKYERFIITFNRYFPHADKPSIIFDFSHPHFHIRMLIFDTVIGICKLKRKLFPAINDIMDIGNRFLTFYIERLINNIDKKELMVFETKKKAEETIEKINEEINTKTIKIEELGEIIKSEKIVEEIEKKIQNNSNSNEQFNTNVSTTIKVSRKNKYNYTDMVKEYCLTRRVFFPEYLIEKHNGVFICTAEFKNEKFTSVYAYTKEEAKEEVCMKIYEFITKNIEKINKVDQIMGVDEQGDSAEKEYKRFKNRDAEKFIEKEVFFDVKEQILENDNIIAKTNIKNEIKSEKISGEDSSPLFVDLSDLIGEKEKSNKNIS